MDNGEKCEKNMNKNTKKGAHNRRKEPTREDRTLNYYINTINHIDLDHNPV